MIEFVILIFSALVLLGICAGTYAATPTENLSTWRSKCFVVFSGVLAIIFIAYYPSERLMPYERAFLSALLVLEGYFPTNLWDECQD